MDSRQASLFRNGRNQALRIPKEFELDTDTVIIRKEGDRLIIEPASSGHRLLLALKSLEPASDDLPEIEDPVVRDEEIFK